MPLSRMQALRRAHGFELQSDTTSGSLAVLFFPSSTSCSSAKTGVAFFVATQDACDFEKGCLHHLFRGILSQ